MILPSKVFILIYLIFPEMYFKKKVTILKSINFSLTNKIEKKVLGVTSFFLY